MATGQARAVGSGLTFTAQRSCHLCQAEGTLDVEHLLKYVVYAAGAVALILFGDRILPAVGHLLVLALEVLESLMDHALETAFDLDPWTAQLITAWTGFFVLLVILVLAVRSLLCFYRNLKVRFSAWCDKHPMHF